MQLLNFTKVRRFRLIQQFLKFCLVGFSNVAVSLAVYYAFIWFRDDVFMAMLGWAIGWIAGVTNSFVWNKKFVFKQSKEIWWRALLKMYMGSGVVFLLSLMFTYIQIEWIGVSAVIVPLINVILSIPINFIIIKYWSFKES